MISEIEKTLGVHIDVEPRTDSDGGNDWYEMSESGNNLILEVDPENSGRNADVYVRGKHLLSTRVGKRGKIIIAKRSSAGKKMVNAVMSKDDIRVSIKD